MSLSTLKSGYKRYLLKTMWPWSFKKINKKSMVLQWLQTLLAINQHDEETSSGGSYQSYKIYFLNPPSLPQPLSLVDGATIRGEGCATPLLLLRKSSYMACYDKLRKPSWSLEIIPTSCFLWVQVGCMHNWD